MNRPNNMPVAPMGLAVHGFPEEEIHDKNN
jgi:hypothetical protein